MVFLLGSGLQFPNISFMGITFPGEAMDVDHCYINKSTKISVYRNKKFKRILSKFKINQEFTLCGPNIIYFCPSQGKKRI